MTIRIPADFPRTENVAALTGVQPKLAVRLDAESHTYTSALTLPELEARYEMCEDLAQQLVQKCRKNRATKYAALTEPEILAALLKKLNATGWGTKAEMEWVIRRTANIFGWTAPEGSSV
jgi:hypothetical protein